MSTARAVLSSGVGQAGNVQWIPRAERNRQQVCGQPPAFANGVPNTAPVTTTTATRPVTTVPTIRTVNTAPPPVAPPPVAVAEPVETDAPRRVQRIDWHAFWFGTPKRRTTTRPAPEAPPPIAVASLPPTAPPATANAQATVIDVPAVAVVNGVTYHGRFAVRTGPQAVHPADAARGRTTGVAVTRAESYTPPPGYVSLLATPTAPARRGVGTAEGEAMMDLVWTDTMPRRLIDARTGKDVTAQLGNINYPYMTASASSSYATATGQVRYDRTPTRTSTPTTTTTPRVKRPVPDEASPLTMIRRIEDTSATTEFETTAPAAVAAAYVQVATFGVPANATRTLARFGEVGLPTAKRPVSRGGRVLEIVYLGPFNSQIELDSALKDARNAGFSDAFAVR